MRARIIRFRAWIKEEKRMLDFRETLDRIKEIFDEHLKSVVMMQGTGLFDTRGQEIFEGDILRTQFIKDMGEKGKIISCVIWNEFIGAWQISYTGAFGDAASDMLHEFKHEIIGNIAQNPELLPKQKTA